MPTGTPYNSFVLPYNIRVDDFATPTTTSIIPALHLLTHTHSDHINGLAAKSFGYTVICSYDAKEMLLRHEVYAERELHQLQLRSEKSRTFSHLKVDPWVQPDGNMYYTGSRDLLKPLPLCTPTRIELCGDQSVTITLIDANHCPGAVMFLIEGDKGAILHTGDFRAEPWFLESLTHNPFLQPYLAPPSPLDILPHPSLFPPKDDTPIVKTLDVIYLDTACLLQALVIPSKERATSGLVELIALFPPTTFFFINSWTWGYEDVLKAIARAFQCKIHVDRYKYSIYTHLSDPFLRSIVTNDPTSTRFHACERFDRCEYVAVDNCHSISHLPTAGTGKRVVIYVNPVTMGSAGWDSYMSATKKKLAEGDVVSNLLVPLSRHSPLPELQAFVSVFRPRRIVPNTLIPGLYGLDWACMDRMFEDCLSSPPAFNPGSHHNSGKIDIAAVESELLAMDGHTVDDSDIALKNLIGDGAAEAAAKWADDGKLRKKLEIVRGFLGGRERALVDRILGPMQRAASEKGIGAREGENGPFSMANNLTRQVGNMQKYAESDDDTGDSDDDERGRTAHRLFANLDDESQSAGWWNPSSSEKRQTEWRGSDSPVSFHTPSKHGSRHQIYSPELERMDARFSVLSSPALPLTDVNNYLEDRSNSPTNHKNHRKTHSHGPVDERSKPMSKRRRVDSYVVENEPATSPGREKVRSVEKGACGRTGASSKTSPQRVVPPEDDRLVVQDQSPGRPRTRHIAHEPRLVDTRGKQSNNTSTPGPPTSKPVSPGRLSVNPDARRHARILKRLEIAEKLSRARPDLVVPSYAAKREKLIARNVKYKVKDQYLTGLRSSDTAAASTSAVEGALFSSYQTVDDGDGDGGIDWERSKELAAAVRAQVKSGRRPMLPPLVPLDQ